jgi:hypothetical protein
MLSTQLEKVSLTDAEVKRVVKHVDPAKFENFFEHFQPIFDGDVVDLGELLLTEDTNQEDIFITKVKTILFKPEVGLVNYGMLLNPVVLATTTDDGTEYIVSGRHRVIGLALVADALGVPHDSVKVKVTRMMFTDMKQLCLACVTFNTNRTMNKTERDDLVLSASSNSLSMFDRVSNTKTLKQAFGIEFADIAKQQLPNTKILRNSFNVLFGTFLAHISRYYPNVHHALMSQNREVFQAAYQLIQDVVVKVCEDGGFAWDGKSNFQREKVGEILAQLYATLDGFVEADEVMNNVKKVPEVKQDEQPKPERKATTNKTRASKVKPVAQPTVTETETLPPSEPVGFDEW